jgi:hypothetical protein
MIKKSYLAACVGLVMIASLAAATQDDTSPKLAGHVPGKAALGMFFASDERGTARTVAAESWLGVALTVGRTYLPGESWNALQGPDHILKPWTRWRAAKPGRMLALNVPMITPNEGGLSDVEVRVLLNAGADGAFDLFFERLAQRLVTAGAADTILVLGWEMNGTTYSSRCKPHPGAWKAYWRRIVETMRAVRGQHFRFDFAPNRGKDAIAWTKCYPGDDVVDIIGMDSYDQAPGMTFDDYVRQPYGLQDQADWAAKHGKPMSYPEWGLFRHGDRPQFVAAMLRWIATHDVAYHSIADYCPHGVWQCRSNARSSAVFRKWLRASYPRLTPAGPPASAPAASPVDSPPMAPPSGGPPSVSAPPAPSTPVPSTPVSGPSVSDPPVSAPPVSGSLPSPSATVQPSGPATAPASSRSGEPGGG